uniref:hypothetical protein n=1 Tax=Ningiella ruwaisensis TaxID=2364274 RepID=UPI0010A062C1|nr:hypothetical protein [Ningiella ruwaisensis]
MDKYEFSKCCHTVSEEAYGLNQQGWKIDLRETENQIRVDFLDFPTEHPFLITTACVDADESFKRLFRKIASLKFSLGGAA